MLREVTIRKVNQGFIIQIGCQTFVSTDEKKMFGSISEYFEYPDESEKKYVEKNTVCSPNGTVNIVSDQFQGNRHHLPTTGIRITNGGN